MLAERFSPTQVVNCIALAGLLGIAVTLAPWLLLPVGLIAGVLAVVLLPVRFWAFACVVSIFLSFGAGLVPPVTVGGLDLRIYDLCLIGFALKSMLHIRTLAWRRVRPLVLATVLYTFAQVAALLLASIDGNTYVASGFVALGHLLMQLIACVLIAGLPSEAVHEKTARILEHTGIVWCGSIVVQWMLAMAGISLGNIYGARFTGFFGDPAQASVVACLLFFIGLARRMKGAGGWLTIALSLLGFILSGTRGSVPVLVVGTLVVFWLSPKGVRGGSGRSVSITLLGALAALLPLWVGPLADRVTGDSLSTSLFMRGDPIVRTWRIFEAHPLSGVGYTGSNVWYSLYSDGLLYERGGTYNQWVQVAAESGILGLLSFVVLLWVAVKLMRVKAIRMGDNAKISPFVFGAVAYVLAVFIGYQTETWWQPGSLVSHVLWVALGLVVGMCSLESGFPVARASREELLHNGWDQVELKGAK